MLIFIFVLGLAVGSFVNAMVYRMIRSENFVNDRSKCDNCGHKLAWYDLVPLLSWVSLGGKCRYCKKHISSSHFWIELATAALFTVSFVHWPLDFSGTGIYLFLIWLIILSAYIALAVYDLREYILPDQYLITLLLGIILFHLVNSVNINFQQVILGALLGGGLFHIIYEISKGKWIGFGDVKMGYVSGAFLGVAKVWVATLVGFYSAALFVLPLLALKKVSRKSRIPFGPFLIFGYITAFLFGDNLYHLLTDVLMYK